MCLLFFEYGSFLISIVQLQRNFEWADPSNYSSTHNTSADRTLLKCLKALPPPSQIWTTTAGPNVHPPATAAVPPLSTPLIAPPTAPAAWPRLPDASKWRPRFSLGPCQPSRPWNRTRSCRGRGPSNCYAWAHCLYISFKNGCVETKISNSTFTSCTEFRQKCKFCNKPVILGSRTLGPNLERKLDEPLFGMKVVVLSTV